MNRILSLACMLLLMLLGTALHAQNNFNSQPASNESGIAPKGEEDDGVFIPNAFTPNDDDVNDIFYIPEANLYKFEIAVYDRWGNRVFYSDNPNFRWNGDSAGKRVPSGVYVYVMSASSPRKADIKRSGTLTIVVR